MNDRVIYQHVERAAAAAQARREGPPAPSPARKPLERGAVGMTRPREGGGRAEMAMGAAQRPLDGGLSRGVRQLPGQIDLLESAATPQALAEAKVFLQGAMLCGAKLRITLERLRTLREEACTLRGAVGGGGRNGPGDRVGNMAVSLADQEGVLLRAYEELTRTRKAVGAAIDRIPDDLIRAALEGRYLAGLSWREVSAQLDVSERHVMRLHRRGIAHVALQRLMQLLC